MANKRAMVIGCKGMDGSHMVDLLNAKGYEVWGISRQDEPHNIKRYAKQVDEIYNFAGKSDVINPFDNVNEIEDLHKIPLTILEQIKGTKVRFFQASSPLIYGVTTPYGAAKAYAHTLIEIYRQQQGVYAVNGIMFPHTSERQKDHFFLKKITNAAARKQKVNVGNLQAVRDYGYTPDYMEAVWLTLQGETPRQFHIATGKQTTLRELAEFAFQIEGLNYLDYVLEDKEQKRQDKITEASIMHTPFVWQAKHNVYATISIMNRHAKTL